MLLDTFRPNVRYAALACFEIEKTTKEVTSAIMKTLSLPIKIIKVHGSNSSNNTTGRRLQIVPFENVLARDQYLRTRKAYRSSWRSYGSRLLTLTMSALKVPGTLNYFLSLVFFCIA